MNYKEGKTLKGEDGKDFKLFGLDYTKMVYVAPGKYKMGEDQEHEIDFANGYFIGKYPVTQELYEAVMKDNPAYFKGKHRPVESVSWNDICEGENSFLTRLHKKIKEEHPDLNGSFALPSEAQWEFAAAGGSHWDKPILKYAGSNKLQDVGWSYKNSNGQTMPVALKQPNDLGIYDMSGNVWEWCQDFFVYNIKSLPEDGTPKLENSERVSLRGSNDFGDSSGCRLRYRSHYQSESRSDGNGFRLVFFLESSRERN